MLFHGLKLAYIGETAGHLLIYGLASIGKVCQHINTPALVVRAGCMEFSEKINAVENKNEEWCRFRTIFFKKKNWNSF